VWEAPRMPASLSTRGVAFRMVKGENWTETTPAEKGPPAAATVAAGYTSQG